ncbi:hypothetical protein FB384_003447 [Prauserella sediminis]|uniref:Uncharacterized protein n=1 Tax=Prauserella sediminis TaxID=577680 RepID=A0A839XVI1_9PSEU|nr:hypothetical protein [Prauserella sediminis]MBB3664543.1 hypothetical protein [Prauserella sediminis]
MSGIDLLSEGLRIAVIDQRDDRVDEVSRDRCSGRADGGAHGTYVVATPPYFGEFVLQDRTSVTRESSNPTPAGWWRTSKPGAATTSGPA